MTRVHVSMASIAVAFCASLGSTAAARQAADQVTVAFSDPGRPGRLRVELVQGSITVRGTNRKDVLVAVTAADGWRRPLPAEATGLRRLTQAPAFGVNEDHNEMLVASHNANSNLHFDIQVPARTNLKLTSVNNGEIVVEAVDGDMEIDNTNGSITLTSVAGSVVANSTNGGVVATLTRVTAQKAMAFTSLNGVVDVTFPPATKANLKLRSDNGDVFTDFDLQLGSQPAATVKEGRSTAGRFQLRVNRSIYGTINGGGPEIEMRTFNGNVYLRKGR